MIALAALISVLAITIADAPRWRLRPYLGVLAAMTASGFVAAANRQLGESLAVLVLAAVLLQRGQALADNTVAALQKPTTPGKVGFK